MSEHDETGSKLTIVTAEEVEGMRRAGGLLTKRVEIDPEQLAVNVNLFLNQMGAVITQAPSEVGGFQLCEIEVSAEITGKGQVILWGVGGELSAGGGLKFVFKKGAGR